MGKNKAGGKKQRVFKVAGAKSLKAKTKAKPVIGNLKKINEIVRKNVKKIDKDLVHLQNDIRLKKKEKLKSNSNKKKIMSEERGGEEMEKERQRTLEKLSEMQF